MESLVSIWGWILENFLAFAAIVISVWAFVRTILIDRKIEKRNLIKERDDLLDKTLIARFRLSDLTSGLDGTIKTLGDKPSKRGREELIAARFMVKNELYEINCMRRRLQDSELTAELIDELANSIREALIRAENTLEMQKEKMAELENLIAIRKRVSTQNNNE